MCLTVGTFGKNIEHPGDEHVGSYLILPMIKYLTTTHTHTHTHTGVGAAKKGALTFMVGGTTDAFERAKPLLDCMGKNVVHCGSHGSGQAVKICNNMLLAVSMIGTSEAMQLGIR